MPSIMVQEIHFPKNPHLKILQPLVTAARTRIQKVAFAFILLC
jgi:hypothetical protein